MSCGIESCVQDRRDIEALRSRYRDLMVRYVREPDEQHLAAVSELGRAMLEVQVPPEEIAEVHEDALMALVEKPPRLGQSELARRSTAPLIELLIAYGLAFRRFVEHEQRERESIVQLNDRLEQKVRERTRELERSRERLQRSERLASVGTLAAGVAHQINNPVGCILASAQYALLCEDEPECESTRKRALEDVVVQAKRCGEIVHDLLHFAREERGRRRVEDANELIQRACQLSADYASQRGVRVRFDESGESAEVLVTRIEMEQVLLNLIHNGIEAAPEGGDVTVCVETNRERVQIEVRDNGQGIEAQALKHVFDPFYTTRIHQGGTGLGLSVAHGIVLDHGGTIAVESEPGIGTCFRIELPRQV